MDHHPLSAWHSIRPWSPRLVLQVKHVSSVAATLVLSPPDDEGEPARPIADILAKGVVVTVNDQPWYRVLVHLDEAANEAMVVIVGLMPLNHYNIELRVESADPDEPALAMAETLYTVHADHDHDHDGDDDDDDDDDDEDDEHDSVPSTPTLAASASPPGTPPPTIDERATQLRGHLSSLASEQSALTEQLKTTRRDIQRSEAALRAEIDAIRRASDKASSAEQRAKQKVLALQEAVKQSIAATSDAKAEAASIENATSGLRKRENELELQVARLREEANRVRAQTDEAVATESKRLADAQQDLAASEVRTEKLNARCAKLEENIPELEQRLSGLLRDNEQLESELAPRPVSRIPLAPAAAMHGLGLIWGTPAPLTRKSSSHSLRNGTSGSH
ncbi:hypothetical protein AURDEDRAFT_179814 [Auricularia subglabra TFB-10046 SS5]|nr:hypothetical protein AURDEDRAFT_179814 [Auricularia subglabra TFB-10046 SS5]